ncbi:MAG: DUF2691 family protein [Lachnospiraceae bacterium]|nr:DUF2691 family protein [Lachnospiraceae bacterium]
MRGVVIEKGEKYVTFLNGLFASINGIQKKYNWLITGHECYPQNEKYVEILSEEYCWLTGDELTEMFENEDFQWIWGVFSAFPKEISKEKVLKFELPKAEGYGRVWQNPVCIQHPLAEIEIIAWDSSMTVFISKDDNIADLLKRNNILAEDVEKYNE